MLFFLVIPYAVRIYFATPRVEQVLHGCCIFHSLAAYFLII